MLPPPALITLNNFCINIWTLSIKRRLRAIMNYQDDYYYARNVGRWGDELDEIQEWLGEIGGDYENNVTEAEFYDWMPEELKNNVAISFYGDINYFVENLTFADSFYMNRLVNNYQGESGYICMKTNDPEELINAYSFVFIQGWNTEQLEDWVDEVAYYEEYDNEFIKWKDRFENYITRYNKYLKRKPIRDFMLKYVKKCNKKKIADMYLSKIPLVIPEIKYEVLKNF